MMILERARACTEKAEHLQHLSASTQDQKHLIERRDEFQKQRKSLSTNVQRVLALRACGFTVPHRLSPTLKQVRGILADLKEKIQSDPRYVITTFSGKEASAFFSDLQSIAQKLGHETVQFWQTYAAQRTPAMDEMLLKSLGKIPAFAGSVNQLQQAVHALKQQGERVPSTVKAVEEFQRNVEEVKRLWEELQRSDVPRPVLDFLNAAASSSGASLEAMTDEVFTWLKQHGLIGNFQVRTRA